MTACNRVIAVAGIDDEADGAGREIRGRDGVSAAEPANGERIGRLCMRNRR